MESSVLRELAIQVSGYFRDFLESDFKKKSAPRRRIVLQSDSGFRCGMRTKPYESLDAAFWQLLGRPSGANEIFSVTPRQHTRSISPTLRKVMDSHIGEIKEEVVERVRASIEAEVNGSLEKAAKDPEAWIDELQAFASADIGERIVRQLVQKLDEPMRRSSYDFVDSLYGAEADMVRMVAAPLINALPDALAKYCAGGDFALVSQTLTDFLQLERIKESLGAFFDGFVTADAFLEVRDIETYATINEGYQLYLYLGNLKFRSAQYPLFFIPAFLNKMDEGRGFQVGLSNQIFANRAAVEFILQELAAAHNREWINPIHERILYLTPVQSILEVARGLYNAVAASFGLAGQTDLSSRSTDATAVDVGLSPSLHLCAFERGEESLVNDYEEIITLARQGGSAVVDLFEKMVGGVLSSNPVSIASEIDGEWDGLPLVDRMVFDSPIPLNEEQRKILLAVRNPNGPIVVVEGPPGTGKSHTITAIAADCAFNQKSCLILSDKAEALQVVHDKLSEAMSRVRHVEDFPNPLLRLGRHDANFKRLVGNQTVSQVSAYAKASAKNLPGLIAERDHTTGNLKADISKTVSTLGSVQMKQVAKLHELEDRLGEISPAALQAIQAIEADETFKDRLETFVDQKVAMSVPDAKPAKSFDLYLQEGLEQLRAAELGASADNVKAALRQVAYRDLAVVTAVGRIGSARVEQTQLFTSLSIEEVRQIRSVVLSYQQLKMPLFGYLFRGAAVRELEARINSMSVREPVMLKAQAELLVQIARTGSDIQMALEEAGSGTHLLKIWPMLSRASELESPARQMQSLLAILDKAPALIDAMVNEPVSTWRMAIDFLIEWMAVKEAFANAPIYDYVGIKTKIEKLNTSLMNAHVDSRLVHFIENHRADAKTMAQLIAQRQKFPQASFGAVKSSFPIIIAGIREFGEYMPLAPELFDVIVIDEASQVSVAQALPALLRAKKIVCLGDSKQFSSVKAANASIALNEKYRSNLVQYFERNVTRDAAALQRLSMFDIKRSVLDFCSLAASYSITLRKHFRSFPELISYSSSTFYSGQLQALKLRTNPVDEVIRFEAVDATNTKVSRSTNQAEADAILARLEELLERDNPPSVGVITPFREQHTLLQKRLLGHPRAQEFEEQLRLKVMTFDSCQGEERSIIFYSLVATPGLDALNYIFPVNLESAEESVEEKLKVQRLNVGFSRAQDCIWIMHSQDVGLYKGALAKALHHYQGLLKRKAPDVSQTDTSSPMEAKLLGWLQETQFCKGQPDDVEIIPQFPISEYLRQLDPTYQHPAWRVDFLIMLRTPQMHNGALHIVVEYDGFEYHFDKDKRDRVHAGNHERYLKDSDVERQLTLESYGYRFLRVNRFNLGRYPVMTLDARLAKLVELATGEQSSKFVERLRAQAEGLSNREMKTCSTCQNIRPLQAFWDKALKAGEGGYGRKCMDCKKGERTQSRSSRR